MGSSYVPPQHGAWAFLALPVLLGVLVTPWTPLILLLALAWIAVYPLSYAAFGLARARRATRFRRPLAAWAVVTLVPAIALVVALPWLVWSAPSMPCSSSSTSGTRDATTSAR